MSVATTLEPAAQAPTPPLRAFSGTLGNKAAVVALAKSHRDQDLLLRGEYGVGDGRPACSIGCMLGGRNHDQAEAKLGLTPQIAHMIDFLFEKQENNEASANFHVAAYESIQESVDYRFWHNAEIGTAIARLLENPEIRTSDNTRKWLILARDSHLQIASGIPLTSQQLAGCERAALDARDARAARAARAALAARDALAALAALDALDALAARYSYKQMTSQFLASLATYAPC